MCRLLRKNLHRHNRATPKKIHAEFPKIGNSIEKKLGKKVS